MTRYCFALSVALSMGLAMANPAAAQCGSCADHDLGGPDPIEHYFQGAPLWTHQCEGPEGKGCHTTWEWGPCDFSHNTCYRFAAFAEAYDQLAADGVLTELDLSVLIAAYPEQATYNAARHAVQIVTCDGAVAAHFPVSAKMARRGATVGDRLGLD